MQSFPSDAICIGADRPIGAVGCVFLSSAGGGSFIAVAESAFDLTVVRARPIASWPSGEVLGECKQQERSLEPWMHWRRHHQHCNAQVKRVRAGRFLGHGCTSTQLTRASLGTQNLSMVDVVVVVVAQSSQLARVRPLFWSDWPLCTAQRRRRRRPQTSRSRSTSGAQ